MKTQAPEKPTTHKETYSVSLQDKPRGYKINITRYPVTKETARKYYIQFLPLWWKKVKFETIEGISVEGYLHGVKGDFSN